MPPSGTSPCAAGLLQKDALFEPEQLAEIYRALALRPRAG